jgi:membrane protein implicated in regulation of membrane protease activity
MAALVEMAATGGAQLSWRQLAAYALGACLLALLIFCQMSPQGVGFILTRTVRLLLCPRFLVKFRVKKISLFPFTIEGFDVEVHRVDRVHRAGEATCYMTYICASTRVTSTVIIYLHT